MVTGGPIVETTAARGAPSRRTPSAVSTMGSTVDSSTRLAISAASVGPTAGMGRAEPLIRYWTAKAVAEVVTATRVKRMAPMRAPQRSLAR